MSPREISFFLFLSSAVCVCVCTLGEGFGKLNLVAGDDAAAVAWTEVHSGLSLYASHSNFVRLAVEHRNAAW